MEITFNVSGKSTQEAVEEFRKETAKWFKRCQEVAFVDGMNQKTIKETRFYEGKMSAYKSMVDFLNNVVVNIEETKDGHA
jgi:endonuclease III-like uncharacterized protein